MSLSLRLHLATQRAIPVTQAVRLQIQQWKWSISSSFRLPSWALCYIHFQSSTMPRSTIPVAEIPTLSLLYKLHKLVPASAVDAGATSRYNDKISLIRADICKLETDAIVNAANSSLMAGGGVCGAIHAVAGPELEEECERIGGCETGDAVITSGYNLPAKKVLHAVGPIYSTSPSKREHQAKQLAACYTRCLDLAVENGCHSVAFSCISTGIYGYPSAEAAATAMKAVKGWLEGAGAEKVQAMERVVFCCFLEKDEDCYHMIIPKFFPPASTEHAATSLTDDTLDGKKPTAAEDGDA